MARRMSGIVKSKPIKFLEELPKHNYNMRKAALAAGYSKETARKPSASIMPAVKNALRELDKEHKNRLYNADGTISQTLGFTPEQLVGYYREILEQGKDMATKLKATTPLLRNLGANLGQDEGNKINVPILNVVIEQKDGTRSIKTISVAEAVDTKAPNSQVQKPENPDET